MLVSKLVIETDLPHAEVVSPETSGSAMATTISLSELVPPQSIRREEKKEEVRKVMEEEEG